MYPCVCASVSRSACPGFPAKLSQVAGVMIEWSSGWFTERVLAEAPNSFSGWSGPEDLLLQPADLTSYELNALGHSEETGLLSVPVIGLKFIFCTFF